MPSSSAQPGGVVISMRPVSVFANGPGSESEQPEAGLRGQWRQATWAVMVLLSLHGLPSAQIVALGGRRLTGRIAVLLARPGVDLAPDPAVPGLAAGQPADAVLAGPVPSGRCQGSHGALGPRTETGGGPPSLEPLGTTTVVRP